ncbi:HNH endonuclease [Streptomyces phage phiSASD1]|uniref:Gp17 n=1 Tax=Streptomyces phage phiSASD1 TaxID=747763 RepID=D7NW86_9CAUD|nr:HNH endonuclease [Streptomyces phage phiSASD1]ADE43484.1 gp17 [Streptomyces phage phiSASD1]
MNVLTSRTVRVRVNRRLVLLGVPAKACSGCLTVKALADFTELASGIAGRVSRCKACHRAGQARLRQDPAYRAAERRQQRPYDRERAQTDSRRSYMLGRSQLRRALEAGAEYDGHQPEDLLIHWDDEDMYACICCGAPFEHVDHNVPLIRGGSHTLDNLVPLCEHCNTSKQGRCPYRFYAERFPALKPYLEPLFDVHERLTDAELAARQAGGGDSSEAA